MSCSTTLCNLVGVVHPAAHGSPTGNLYLVTLGGTITTGGVFSVTTSYGPGFSTTQAPSVTYIPGDNTFVLAYVGVDGQSLYATKRYATDPTWPTPGGPLASFGSAALSPPSVGNWTQSSGFVGVSSVVYGP